MNNRSGKCPMNLKPRLLDPQFQCPFQEPIDWRYLPYIRPIFEAYVREYPHKIWSSMVQYLHFRILNFPMIVRLFLQNHHLWLVGGIPTPLKNMSSSMGRIIPCMKWTIKHVWNHQPDEVFGQPLPLWILQIFDGSDDPISVGLWVRKVIRWWIPLVWWSMLLNPQTVQCFLI